MPALPRIRRQSLRMAFGDGLPFISLCDTFRSFRRMGGPCRIGQKRARAILRKLRKPRKASRVSCKSPSALQHRDPKFGAGAVLREGLGAQVHHGGDTRDSRGLAGPVLDGGFQLRALKEPRLTAEALIVKPDLEDAARVPIS